MAFAQSSPFFRSKSRKMSKAKKPGFTLVELLVVIAIIGVLVALLLPAVQMAREAARRMQCSNNLHQLGIALHNYHDTHGSFCPGFMAVKHDGSIGGGWGWAVFLMPFIEQSPLQNTLSSSKYTLSEVISDPALLPMLQMKLDSLRCPSSPMEDLREFKGEGAQMVATSNYTCSRGFFDIKGSAHLTKDNNGLLFGRSHVKFAQIYDGTSNTIAIGERTVLPVHMDMPSKWPSWCGPGGLGIGSTVSSNTSINMNHPSNMHAYSSEHPGGANFLFADGSARFISETIRSDTGGLATDNSGSHSEVRKAACKGDLGAYQLLGIRNDGAVITDDF